MIDKKLKTLSYRLKDLTTLRNLFSELNFDFADDPVNKDNWNDQQKHIVKEAKIIARKHDYKIYYIQTNTDSLKEWKGISSKIIKDNNGLCMVCSHNPCGIKWIFSSLSKNFSESFSETRHVPIDINLDTGVSNTFVEFLEKIKVGKDSTSVSIASQISHAFDSFAIQIRDELTVNVFDALKVISEGIVGDKSNNLLLTDKTLEEIRESIFILLYRIIFILYAEDRGIFPIDNTIYKNEFSLKWVKEKWILEYTNTKKMMEYDVQKRIKKLFKLIEIGSEELNYNKNDFFMRSYYGRIFDRKIYHKLEDWNIPNSNFLEMLSLLTRTSDKQKNYYLLDYSALDTRHLGSIYEHLLEFHLHVKGNEIAELPNPKERKITGSYYTPKYVVEYMVEDSIRPLIDSIIKKNPDKYAQIEQILSLKILDPAMGSGHFLVGAVEYMAKRLCEIEFGNIPEQSYIERKRDVVRRCLYGVDINPLSVDLARLSLWLETLSSEKPLSFLSSHLKCGNSLISENINSIFNERTTLFESEKSRNSFRKNLKKFLMFETLEDDSSLAVKMKLEEYAKIQSKGTIYYDLKFLLDSTSAIFFGITVPNLGDYRAKIGENSIDFYVNDTFKKIKILSEKEKFFHWELEFPQVFFNAEGKKKIDGGFDCIIGNPPYVMIEYVSMYMREYLYKNYALGKRFDIFEAFIEKSFDLLSESRTCCFILPNTFLTGSSFSKLREIILKNFNINKIIDMPQGIFKSVTVDNVIISLSKNKNPDPNHLTQILKLDPNDDPLKLLEKKSKDIFLIEKKIFTAAEKFRMNINFTEENKLLFEKIETNSVRLEDETESSQGIILYKTKDDSIRNEYTGYEKKSPQWKKLLRGTNIGRYVIKWDGEYVKYGNWLWSQRNEKFFYNDKIILQALRNKSLFRRLIATFDSEKYYNAHNLANIISKQNSQYSFLFSCEYSSRIFLTR